MNIDLWVARDSDLAEAAAHPVAADASVHLPSEGDNSAVTSTMVQDKPLGTLSPAELADKIPRLSVVPGGARMPAELLVLTEDVTLSDECSNLLGSMFKAIKLESSQWLHAGVSAADGAELISQVESSVQPKATVIMLKANEQSHDPVNAMRQLRGVQHKARSLQSFVVVTFHPQDLLDNPDLKRPAWEDLKQLRRWLP